MAEISFNLASRWKRLGGAVIDSVISIIIIMPIMLLTGVLQEAASGKKMSFTQSAVFFVIGWVVFLALNGYFLAKNGQTIGKLVLKTKIVDINGNIPLFGKLILLRYFIFSVASQIPILGPIAALVNALFIFGKERRCLHDYLAGTRVVNA